MPRQRKLPAGMCKRGDAYYSAFRAGGRLVRKRLSTDFKAACEILNELRSRADRADYDLIDNDCSWADLKAEFLKWARQSVRRPEEYAADLTRFESYTVVRNVRQVTHAHVVGYREWRLSQFVQGRRKLAMLNKAVEWKRIGSNAIKGLKPLRNDAPCKDRRALDTSEVARLFETSPAHLRPVWRMFMSSAVRRAELVNMRFADVDFERRTVTVRASTAKNHKAREIPLGDTMLAMLAELRDAAQHRQPRIGRSPAETALIAANFSRDHVFVSRSNTPILGSNLLERFYAICDKAGIDGAHSGGSVDLHSLRVTCATLMLQNGANPKDVQAILGHSTLALTMKVYAKATESGKRSAVSALPFETMTAPAHVVSMRNVPTVCATNSNETQPLAIAGVA